MNKRSISIILSIALIFTASYLYFTNASTTLNTESAVDNVDEQLINSIVEIEKNLTLGEFFRITFADFKDETSSIIHSHYRDTYFENTERYFNGQGILIPFVKPPIYFDISKVYSNGEDTSKQIFVKCPEISPIDSVTQMSAEGPKSQSVKVYSFKKENEQWKIFSVSNYLLSIDRNEPKIIIDRFANFNGVPIEYESIKIYE